MAKLLITTVAGPDDPTRASLGFHIAVNGAVKSQIDTSIAMVGDAIALLKPGAADGVRGVGVPPLAELLVGCVAAGIKIYVWKGCAEARGVSQQDFAAIKAEYMTPPTYTRMVMEADRNISF